jgi:polysaccharide biosynthesis/export protein
MFKVPEETALANEIQAAEKNYVIQKNDFLALTVYTNEGERLIDPDFQLMKDLPNQNASGTLRPQINYLINAEGGAKLPMVGQINLTGLTLLQAEQLLQKEYTKFYQKPFVVLEFQNKRVIVLGSPGGQVLPLANQNTRLVEVLAMAKGIDVNGKAQNIRVLRGDQVFLADFSTFESYTKSNILIEPGDVVYVEPIRRPVAESFRDYGPVVAVVSSLTTLVVVLVGL